MEKLSKVLGTVVCLTGMIMPNSVVCGMYRLEDIILADIYDGDQSLVAPAGELAGFINDNKNVDFIVENTDSVISFPKLEAGWEHGYQAMSNMLKKACLNWYNSNRSIDELTSKYFCDYVKSQISTAKVDEYGTLVTEDGTEILFGSLLPTFKYEKNNGTVTLSLIKGKAINFISGIFKLSEELFNNSNLNECKKTYEFENYRNQRNYREKSFSRYHS